MADKTIDIRGLICPYTLLATRDALKSLTTGQVLEVLCDNESAATTTIPNFCQKKGYPFQVSQDGAQSWRLRIEKMD
ncbi:MAG: sulfurtransferase TusA family protein [Abditibacteriales bacterium]|nr:sulfurtransferase TusA family protein [Abditibacteriales bacterium]MDW8368226.1 sulfurtransferase TusA family protein [Abditibacteriales bacterium]